VPRLIPLENLRRARFAAYGMAFLIIALSFTNTIWAARSVLFLIGVMGGMFIVPINAALQELGQQTIGSGHAIALQGFFQNVAMLLAVGIYSFAASQHVNPILAMLCLGGFLLIAVIIVSFNLRRIRN
jgi:LPLT family lysophospholipid transporter-like MFS transporter